MQLRELNIGCFGGGTGLPSLLGGLKNNPWHQLNAVVTMFDSGGSSGQLRDELGVLPPGDVLKCALALARNEGEARRVLLADMRGPNVLISNLLTEGRGMAGFTAAESARWVSEAIDRPVDVVIANTGRPSLDGLMKYAAEHKEPLELGEFNEDTQVVQGRFWCTDIARHDRRRLAFAVWSVLSERLLQSGPAPVTTTSA